MPGIDLHSHSTASDGSLTPSELARAGKEAGLEALALTDHDTAAGLPEFMAAGARENLETIPGCELSVTTPRARMHILGLWLPMKPGALTKALKELRQHRHQRNHIIIAKLAELGLEITYDEVVEIAGEGSVGRPHLAKALLNHGYVKSMEEAFDRYLGAKGKAYAPKKVLTAADAVALLKQEGATVIMAHPYQSGLSINELTEELIRLKELGLDGLEAYYNDHTPSRTAALLELANRLNLAVSGGSDFHGEPKPDIKLGKGRGTLYIPLTVLERLKELRLRQGLPV